MEAPEPTNFLRDLANKLILDYKGDFSDLKVILPSKRAVLFFKYHLSQTIEKSSWAPDIITISEWISELTTLEVMDKTALLFELFKVVKTHLKEDDTIHEYYSHFINLSFDNFYRFGETLLSDFNEIDAYNVNYKDLFRILKEHAELESEFNYLSTEQIEAIQYFWRGFNVEKLSNEQKGFIELWKFLPGLYAKFSEHLTQIGSVYNGLNYKSAVNGIKDETVKFDSSKDYVFAGFNALNTCEISILESIQAQCNVSFYWDADRMFVENQDHEAGYFIRKLIKKFPHAKGDKQFPENILKREKPFIHLIGTSSIELQVKTMSSIMRENPEVIDQETTAIILSDEIYLFPTLYSLPEETNHLNVTMGYPIKDSSLYSFVELYFSLYKSLSFDQNYYFKTIDILKLLRNPFLEKTIQTTNNIASILTNKKKKFSLEEIEKSIDNNIVKMLFKRVSTGNELIDILRLFFETLLKDEKAIESLNDFEKEFYYYIYTHIGQVNSLLIEAKEQINFASTYHIVIKGLSSLRVPFTGEPISGMQIMGVLETRSLDFKTLFILGLNEGVWPKVSTPPSLIPENIRKGFGLTTIQYQDSIYGYYFYRLLQRSEDVYLFYNNVIGDNKGKEMSRFITQLDKLHPELIASRKTIQLPLYNKVEQEINIERTPEILNKLKEYATASIKPFVSASAINTYMMCHLQFYFKYIMKWREPKTDFDKIDKREVGNLFHYTMEYLYSPYKGKKLEKTDFNAIYKDMDRCIQMAYNNEFLGDPKKSYQLNGEDKIISHLIRKYVNTTLQHDETKLPFTVIDTEATVKRTIQVPTADGKTEEVLIQGFIDRVDKQEGLYSIIDYKTGDPKINEVKNIALIFDQTKRSPKAILQMILYTFLFQKDHPGKSITPYLYTIRSLRTDKILINKTEMTFTPEDEEGIMASFIDELKLLLNEMFFSLTPFSKTEEKKNCEYCPYKNICGR